MASLDAILRVSAKGDASGLAPLTRGLQQVKAAGAGVSNALGSLGGIFGSVTGGIVGLGAGLSAAGVAAFAKSVIDAADNMRDLSQQTGASVENLSRFEQAAAQSGTNINTVTGAMIKLSRGMAEAAETGKGPAAEALQRLGISAVDASGQLLGADEVMLRIAERFQQMPDGAQKAALAVQLFGKGGAAIIPMLNGGRQAIEGLDAAMTQAFTDKADEYNDNLQKLSVAVSRIGVAIADDLLPYLTQGVEKIAEVVGQIETWYKQNEVGIQNTIKLLGQGISYFAASADKILNISNSFGILKDTLGFIANLLGINTAGTQQLTAATDQTAQSVDRLASRLPSLLPPVATAKEQQEAFKAAVDQSNASYQLLGATIDSTAQAIDRQGKLKIATLDADIAVNNAAKSILEIKLSQARTEGERIAILQRIQGIEIENARIQQRAQGLQLDAEIRQADLRRQKERNQLAEIQRQYDIARAMGQQNDAIAQQLHLQAIKLKDAEGELKLTRLIADEKRRGIQAETDAKIAQARARTDAAGSSGGSSGGGSRGSALPGIRTPYPMVGQASVQAQQWAQRTTFAGGGYTGNAPRSGGLDGKGGFMAMLHPRETVIDHTAAGGGAAPSVTIKTGPVMQMADGSQWVSMADLEQAMQATAAGVFRQLRSPSSRLAMGGA